MFFIIHNPMKKINQYKNTYNKEYGALGTILFVGFLFYCYLSQQSHITYIKEKEQVTVVIAQVSPDTLKVSVTGPVDEQEVIIQKIKDYFPRNADTMVAIAKAESHLNPEAKGYNCWYNAKETIVYTTKVKGSHSTSCKVSHRMYAYSVDCGVLQKNYKGRTCPVESLDQHLEIVRDLSLLQGLEAWSAYNNGSYKKYLTVK